MKVTGEKADLGTQDRAELRIDLERALRLEPKTFSNVPTAQRTRRAGVLPKIERVIPEAGESSPRAHRYEAPLEAIRHKLFAHEWHAGDRLRWAHESRAARPRIGDYGNGAGRSDPATRSGISPVQLRAAARWKFFEPYLWPVRDILDAMLLRKPNGEEPTVSDAMEFARAYTPTVNDKTAKPVWEVLLRRACRHLTWVEYAYDKKLSRERREATVRREDKFRGDRR